MIARKAAAFEKQGEYDQALDQYRIALLEDNAVAIKDAKRRCEKVGKEAAAKAYLDPELAEKHKDAGNELFKAGTFPAALKEFDEGLRRDPKNKACYSNRAACYLKLLDPVSALRDADKAISMDDKFVRAWARKGTAHQMMKEYHKAMDAYNKGLAIDGESNECKQGLEKTVQLI